MFGGGISPPSPYMGLPTIHLRPIVPYGGLPYGKGFLFKKDYDLKRAIKYSWPLGRVPDKGRGAILGGGGGLLIFV